MVAQTTDQLNLRTGRHMPQQLRTFSILDPENEVTRSWDILKRAHESATSLLASFNDERDRGTPSDTEQDLLRAMIVFAAAGLDAMLKQLLSDCLSLAVERSEDAAGELAEYLRRRIRDDSESTIEVKGDRKRGLLLTKALISDSPRKYTIDMLIKSQRKSSLQSPDEVVKALQYLDLPTAAVLDQREQLKSAFDARNLIVHEMDIDFGHYVNRSRVSRTRPQAIRHSNTLLGVADLILRDAINCFGSTTASAPPQRTRRARAQPSRARRRRT